MAATIVEEVRAETTASPEPMQRQAPGTPANEAFLSAVPLYIPTRRLWTRQEYERMMDLGLFAPDERLELIEGEIVTMPPMKTPHATGIGLAQSLFSLAFGAGYHTRTQMPLNISGERSQPEPDVAVVVGTVRDYEIEHPTSAALIVEVSDTTLSYDQTTKVAIYARAGIPDCWVTDINNRVLEIYRDPAPMVGQPLGFGYRSITRYTETQTVSPLAVPGYPMLVSELLPRPPAVAPPTFAP